jgi:two-component system chemotaxis response regulator CheY
MAVNILVVEDSQSTRSLVALALEEIPGVSLIEASNGFEALKTLPNHKFDVIITDINMPEINGLELIRFIKDHPVHKETPIIIISTERSEEDRTRGLKLGASAYLTKPFSPDEIVRAVRQVIVKHPKETY